jgi:hypothetical protein
MLRGVSLHSGVSSRYLYHSEYVCAICRHRKNTSVVGLPDFLKLALSCYTATEEGIRYFFRSPLPLIRYLKTELPLPAGPQLSALVRYSATAILSVVGCN